MICTNFTEFMPRFDVNNRFEFEDWIRVTSISDQFLSSLTQSPTDYVLYAFTLTPKEGFIRNHVGWYDMDARERTVYELFSSLIHRISSRCCPNYRRDIHKEKRIRSLCFVEHNSRKTSKLVVPHIHAVVAVPSQVNEKFIQCFSSSFAPTTHGLGEDFFKGGALRILRSRLNALKLEEIQSTTDLYRWIQYSSKYLDDDFQGTLVFDTILK